ncbi:hypothetical protein IMG5_148300 [Ichthyophthirius multifiliis]|uniref:Autophagocytosis associated protein n=1 Tax=Ichthyophthirius multifiliis TaxID=5932 RepID=G0QY98_ICHMU|nr:hypothetical protein IMG5_148300 [Ichthyophthirius multifiliis]EGR29802.1 hypothetical protein IMG5_148300 [Ichthyophthirius multifiliis]|eukprot:XP_004031038.1 hypothetical protein IMG5_148300 [Ichthyophthirius multifiliis]
MDYIKNKLNNVRMGITTALIDPPTESIFFQEGQLTVNEFVQSGDRLIQSCPSWKWKNAISDKYQNNLLPSDKQYLLLERVPCNQRICELQENINIQEKLDNEDDWVINEQIQQEKKQVENKQIEEEQQLKQIYDFYYYTPRLYITGVDENNNPLTQEEIFQDIINEYANKTVTFEEHPHLGTQQASLHPCKHAKVIKHMVDTIQGNGGIIEPHMAIQIFLKFLASVIPTIEYDIANDFYL